jgi:hypothetical protein
VWWPALLCPPLEYPFEVRFGSSARLLLATPAGVYTGYASKAGDKEHEWLLDGGWPVEQTACREVLYWMELPEVPKGDQSV